ncbi:CbtB domain-containing protein [Cumulibacter manganitolerans]|uniref:CbtB domain-containing protein n=1 Tax=Cumulibacter manganitolerans TaxID=1884992 RepID=UPI0012977002|nr:CbtB-domain containing protein [Cumulibacter manganitolerans]
MTATTIDTRAISVPGIDRIPVRELVPYLIFFGIVAVVAMYFVGVEQGVFSVFSGATVHEWVHDGRHLLGFPCH